MNKKYRIMHQSEGFHHVLLTDEMSEEKAHEMARAEVSAIPGALPYHLTALSTAKKYAGGHIQFCPRCGYSIGEQFEYGDPDEGAINDARFHCEYCEASGRITIDEPDEEEEETDEDE